MGLAATRRRPIAESPEGFPNRRLVVLLGFLRYLSARATLCALSSASHHEDWAESHAGCFVHVALQPVSLPWQLFQGIRSERVSAAGLRHHWRVQVVLTDFSTLRFE